ncbi:hypothetical protein [Streptomyces xiamenensis]|uniref:hypothetical protein n=1 Tax=Streptomyces xiamenensis TaxID=408015 RepID=UPI003D7585BA
MSAPLTPEREATARAIAQAATDDEIIVSDCEGALEVWRTAALPNFKRDGHGYPSWIVPSSYRPNDLVIEIDLSTWDRDEDPDDDQRRDDIEQLVTARQEIVPALLAEIDRLRAAAAGPALADQLRYSMGGALDALTAGDHERAAAILRAAGSIGQHDPAAPEPTGLHWSPQDVAHHDDGTVELYLTTAEGMPAILALEPAHAAALAAACATQEPGLAAVLRLDLYRGPEVTVRLDDWDLTVHPEHDVTAQALTVLSGWVSVVDTAELPDGGPLRIAHAYLPGTQDTELSEITAYLDITETDGARRASFTWTGADPVLPSAQHLLPWAQHLTEEQLTELLDGLADAAVPHAPAADRLARVTEVLTAGRNAALDGAA